MSDNSARDQSLAQLSLGACGHARDRAAPIDSPVISFEFGELAKPSWKFKMI